MAQPQLVRNSAILQTGEICSFMVKKSRVVYSCGSSLSDSETESSVVEANLLITRL